MTTTHAVRIRPIEAAALTGLRERDDAGRTRQAVVEQQENGEPLRCCLRRSRPGEHVMLVSYAPLRRWAREVGEDPGAYDEVGPVFIHAHPCAGPDRTDWPEELRGTRRVLRAYTKEGKILRGHFLDSREETQLSEQTAVDLLADAQIAVVHVRAVEFGCFLFEVRRAGQSP